MDTTDIHFIIVLRYSGPVEIIILTVLYQNKVNLNIFDRPVTIVKTWLKTKQKNAWRESE